MAIKLYMSKAYGRMKWAFVETIMSEMDFSIRWIVSPQRALLFVSMVH